MTVVLLPLQPQPLNGSANKPMAELSGHASTVKPQITTVTETKTNGNAVNGVSTQGPVYAPIFAVRPRGHYRYIPPSNWTAAVHPRVDQVTMEVDDWFLDNWPFPNDKARRKFVDAGFSRVTCAYFPLALDDRIHLACRLLTILFLIDDLLEDMSFSDGEKYNASLMPIARGDVQPDRKIPVEWMFYDLWESMRAHDKTLADEILEPVFVFMRAQTDSTRRDIKELGHYLEYREKDVGKALLSALMRFSMQLYMTPQELAAMKAAEQNCSKHISVVNDIYSWEKELAQSLKTAEEGSVLCSAVKVLADNTALDIDAARACLWTMVREWEAKHELLCSEPHMSARSTSKAQMLSSRGWSTR
ncbi:aristolochene synthase [Apiospora phragmitis]|uniref:Terpene synthase n=1 Tax=Apiospora phragmitis TaxID=2905665 RepID=A0ABR1X7J0_9PEZI